MPSRSLVPKLLLLVGVLTVAGLGIAEPVLHEYFEVDGNAAVGEAKTRPGPNGSSSNGAASSGVNAGAVSGAPTSGAATGPHGDAQSGGSPNTDSYQLDGNTTRPEEVGYQDPFTPSIPPFKRLYAYDAVDGNFELVVANRDLVEVPIGGAAQASEDQFFAEMDLALQAGVAERIPSVGPSTRVLAARLTPPGTFRLVQDSAENWFVVSRESRSARLTLHLSIDRRIFGSAYGDPEWSELAALRAEPPAHVQRRAVELAAALGVSRELRPREALARLVTHFRAFAPSEELPNATERGALFREIALSQKGVCRHRSYAFVVTALGLGIPSRFIRNEAHAWVEVHDGALWHRIDLGGAAGEMQLSSTVDMAHVPPADPFEWPEGSESAEDMTRSALGDASGARGEGNGRGPNGGENSEAVASSSGAASADAPPVITAAPRVTAAPERSTPSPASSDVPEEMLDTAPASRVDVESHAESVMQGARVAVSGTVAGDAGPCALVRVDVILEASDRSFPVGTLVTDERGHYAGEVTLPGSVPVGDYELRATTRGAAECGAGSSR